MSKKVYTVAEVPDSKRTSDRVYTHAVIGQYDFHRRLKEEDVVYDGDIEYHSRMLARANKFSENCINEHIKKYGHMTPNEYGLLCYGDRMAHLTEHYEAEDGKYKVLRWSQSEANAGKGWTEFSAYKNIKVVKVTQIK